MAYAAQAGRLLVAFSAHAEPTMMAVVSEFLCGSARAVGLPDEDVARLRALSEEVWRYVVKNSFDPGDPGQVNIALWRQTEELHLIVEDRGLPAHFDGAAPLDHSQLPLLPLRAFADEFEFHNLGKDGKRLEFILRLDATSTEQVLSSQAALAAAEAVGDETISLRLATADDALSISQCVYRNYALTYFRAFLYYPAKIAAMLASGDLESCIAVTGSGRVAGHLAILYEGPDSKVCETGMAVVDPAFRGRRLFEQMKAFAHRRAIERNMYGLCSDAVTVHPYSQRSNLTLGARETGVMLAYLPEQMLFKSISQSETAARQSNILFFMKACPIPRRYVYLPEQHAEIIEKIYARLDLPRRRMAPDREVFDVVRGVKTQFKLSHKLEIGLVFMRVITYGSDVLLVVHNNIRDITRQSEARCIYLDLPLRDPLTAVLCKGMEAFGFSFSGVLIELHDGDFLRFQYLNDVTIKPDDIKVASDFGAELTQYVLDQRELVTRNSL